MSRNTATGGMWETRANDFGLSCSHCSPLGATGDFELKLLFKITKLRQLCKDQ